MQYKTMQELINGGFGTLSEEHVLIRYRKKKVTASELNTRSRSIMRRIRMEKLYKNTPIALLMEDRIELIAGIIGILEAACVFVPLETNLPVPVIKEMLRIAKVQVVLMDDHYEKYNDIFEELKIRVINVQTSQPIAPIDLSDESDMFDQDLYDPEDPIYIYFTSGTTNNPKAILGRNKGLAHFIQWESGKVGHIKAKISQLTSPCHDPFLRDIFLAINLGGTICIPDSRNVLLDGRILIDWIRDSEINIVHCTPSLFHHMVKTMDKPMEFPELQYIFLAGEKINPQDIKKWFQRASGKFHLENLYGPTETTLAKLCHDISSEDGNLHNIPIGRPIDGTEAFIFNESMQICDVEEIGEICISTPYRSLGYIDNEEMNKAVFVSNPLSEDKNDIIYKTGDLGCRLADGNIKFIGRRDNQVKIRGNRVELGYIEHRILEMEHIKECVAVFNADEPGNEYIAVYIVSETPCTKGQVINFLKVRMPDYMLPTHIVFMDVLPLNNNMKINKKALPDPRCVQEETIVDPHNDIESKLVVILQNILNVKQISITDSFFVLGLTSLAVMSLISQVFSEFQVEISLEDVFNSPSLEEFSGLIEERLQSAEEENCDSEMRARYSIQEYDKYSKENYRYVLPLMETRENKLKGIQPFNEVFYQSCVSNSLFSVINYYGADLLPLFVNDIILYASANDMDVSGNIEYHELDSMENILKSMGIGANIVEKNDNVIMDLIQSIDKQRPVIIGVDCFFESIRPEHYKKSNWPHNLLVYGYNNEKQEMIVLEHTGVNNLDYHEQKISYVDLDFAYHNNLLKFRNFEKGIHYMEFYKISDYRQQGANVYFKQYRNNIINHMDEILLNLNNLPDIIYYLKQCTVNLDQIKKNSVNMIHLLDSIIEAKYAQIYLFNQFSEYDAELQKGSKYFKSIAKTWKLIRNVIYRSTLCNERSSESYENAFDKSGEIYDNERQFYSWLNKYEGV